MRIDPIKEKNQQRKFISPKKVLLLFAFLAFVIALIIFSSFYLTYVDSPAKSDAVVLLLGKESDARKKEAEQLIADGYSKYLVIPYRAEVFKSSDSDGLVPIKQNTLIKNRFITYKKKHETGYFESTHLEISHAKTMMDELGFRSGMFISSPYHMRRVRLIAESVFKGGGYQLLFVPTRYEKTNGKLWWLYRYDLKRVAGEYVKIVWFLLYSSFS